MARYSLLIDYEYCTGCRTSATDDASVPDTGKSGRANAIIS